mmetsp:Transcript_81019/g.251901  ORF Transcript_81019/g.251901 Transcript_81019/m.251901 type:complete len:214 (-) Transcript_81019:72-713(-)
MAASADGEPGDVLAAGVLPVLCPLDSAEQRRRGRARGRVRRLRRGGREPYHAWRRQRAATPCCPAAPRGRQPPGHSDALRGALGSRPGARGGRQRRRRAGRGDPRARAGSRGSPGARPCAHRPGRSRAGPPHAWRRGRLGLQRRTPSPRARGSVAAADGQAAGQPRLGGGGASLWGGRRRDGSAPRAAVAAPNGQPPGTAACLPSRGRRGPRS